MLKRVFVIVAGMSACLLVALSAYVGLLFDPGGFRDRLIAQVSAQTGRELVIAGDIGVSLFPWPGVELTGLALTDRPGFGERPFAQVARLRARPRLMPLLRGEVEMDRVLLSGVVLHLVRRADGQSNWMDLFGTAEEGVRRDALDPRGHGAGPLLGSAAAFVLSGVEVDSGSVSWDDQLTGTRHRLHSLSITTGEVRAGRAFPLEITADIESNPPAMTARLAVSGQVLRHPDMSQVAIDALTVRVDAHGEAVPGGTVHAELSAAVAIDLAADTLTVSRVVLRSPGMQGNGELQVVELSGQPRYVGSAQAEMQLRELGDREARLTGAAQWHARLQARGSDGDALKRGLGGEVSFRVTDGAVRGINLAQLLREAEARLKGLPLPGTREPNQTAFTELSGTLTIVDGIAHNDDLHAYSPWYRVTGSGHADLAAERIDYRFRVDIVDTLTGEDGPIPEALRGISVPISVTGSFDSPVYALDVDSLIPERLRRQARERIETHLPEGAAEALKDKLRRGLRGLLR